MIRQLAHSPGEIRKAIRKRKILFAGNASYKIYGTLRCSSGKRMKKENRVFFKTENEARQEGFRPCGHCMQHAYQAWRNNASLLTGNR